MVDTTLMINAALCDPISTDKNDITCLGDYVSVTVWYDETVVVVGSTPLKSYLRIVK